MCTRLLPHGMNIKKTSSWVYGWSVKLQMCTFNIILFFRNITDLCNVNVKLSNFSVKIR